jgi:hypothetical protein
MTSGARVVNRITGGLALGVTLLFLLAPLTRGGPDALEASGGGPGGVEGAGLRSPAREAADQLFERVVEAAEVNDSAQLALYLPMAVLAYQRARPLDADGLFHLSTLQRSSDLLAEARATADESLAANPHHLLGLFSAAQASEEVGDTAAARGYYARILASWDREMVGRAPEYRVHAEMLESVRERAQRILETG